MLVIDTRIKLLLFILINFMVFGLKDFILGSVCFFFICILSCLMGQKKIVLKYLIFYVVIAAIQQLCAERGCYYLDLNAEFADADGYLSAEFAQPDGVHLTVSATASGSATSAPTCLTIRTTPISRAAPTT